MNKRRKMIGLISGMCLFALLLTACGAEKNVEQLEASSAPAEIVAPAAEPTPAPTAEPSAIVIDTPAATDEPVDISEYIGCYANDNYDTVTIDISDEGFSMSVSLYRLAALDEGMISATAEGIEFHTVDGAGEPMTMAFYRDGDGYALRIDESTWSMLEPGTVVTGLMRTTRAQVEAGYSAADPEDGPDAHQGHYVFQPKICSVYMEEVFGKDMCDAWCNLVDAVMAGENTFACKDQHTYDWMMGQFPEHCLPILPELIDYAYDREHSVIDGVASFTWLVPPEEAKARIESFGKQIEGILNEVLEDDYSDLEKALALYVYFSEHYEYDYDTYMQMYDKYVDYTSCYRFFQTGIGICHEISSAYSYLLMQAGVQATSMSGNRGYDQAGHQWSFVRINGKNYHIDPTYALGTHGQLRYFMMTDEKRAEEDDYIPSTFYAVSHYSRENPHPDYTADDDTFRPLWDKDFDSFSHETHTIRCWTESGYYGEWTEFLFDYAGY